MNGLPTPNKLAKDLQHHFTRMEPLRDIFTSNRNEYAGTWWINDANENKPRMNFTNVLFESIQAVRPALTAEEIEPAVRPKIATKDLDAQILKSRLERIIAEQEVAAHMNLSLDDAMLAGLGCVLVMQEPTEKVVEIDQQQVRLGQTVVRSIAIEDLVIDMDARHMGELRLIGDKRRISRRKAIELQVYGRDPMPGEPEDPHCFTKKEAIEQLQGTPNLAQTMNQQGTTTQDVQGQEETAKDIIEVWELIVWCDEGPYRIVVPHTTSQASGGEMNIGNKFLVCEPYDGPEKTGYCFLSLIDVRGASIGLSYASSLRDLHEVMKKIGNKVYAGIMSSKNLGWYTRGNQDTADTAAKAPTGHMIAIDEKDGVGSFELGGFSKNLAPGLEFVQNQVQKRGGNPDLLSGTGSIADTATESSILNSGAQKRAGEFYRKVLKFGGDICKRIAWYEYFNPLARWDLQLMIGQAPLDVSYGADMREGDQLDAYFDISCNMVSVAQTDPAVRLQRVSEFLTFVHNNLDLVMQGILSFEGLLMIGRQEFGIRNIDLLFPNPERLMAMVQEMANQAGPQGQPQIGMKQPGRPQMGQPARAGGTQAQTSQMQSAYAPQFAAAQGR